ncbi:aminoacyl-tRNA hydrolase [Candidatus Gracilibacteria bacterium]|nr:aminoacyl-tRNA hydrolase [Candidatus Gracilibacteria bacterium]
MKLIIGLGNPGKEYAYTRHNIGFILLDTFREKGEFGSWEDSKWKAVIARSGGSQYAVELVKPITYMNLSGDSVSALVNYYKLDPRRDILVISDDIDMEFGKIRYRTKGSHGGQNGLRDIIAKLGTDEFARIKIGIGRDARYSVSDWVLSMLTLDEQKHIEETIFLDVRKKIEEWINTP